MGEFRNLLDAFRIGVLVEYIRLCCELKFTVVGKGFLLDGMREISKLLGKYNLDPNVRADIDEKCSELQKKYKENQALDSKDAEYYCRRAVVWYTSLEKVTETRNVIEVFTGGTLNYNEMLSKGAKIFFEDNVWEALSRIGRKDIEEACKCLLTQSWTAATMVSLRAAEDALRNYYEFKTKKDAKGKSWGRILGELQKSPEVSKSLTGYLNYIREIRNAAEHPEKIFNRGEAETIIPHVVNVINVTYGEMLLKERKVEAPKSPENKKLNKK